MSQFQDSGAGQVFERVSREAGLLDELKRQFDIVIGMNCVHSAPKGSSIATSGLSGCVAGYIDSGYSHTLFHFAIQDADAVEQTLRLKASKGRVHFFVPGAWGVKPEGGWGLQPELRYIEEILGPSLDYLRHNNIEAALHGYQADRAEAARYQGTVWVDRTGGLFADGIPVSNMTPLHARLNPVLS